MVALGRLVEHDPRSKLHPARRAARPRTVLWDHHAPVLDQGELGSCTGNALAQLLNTTKFTASRPKRKYLDERSAVDLYSVATGLDDIDGTYPPVDTGSSGLGVAKAGVRLGYLSAYQHAFGFVHFAEAIQLQPLIVGSNWYDAMFEPDVRGFVKPVGEIAGGHEYLALGINYAGQYVTCLNSWSAQWGLRGRFRLTFADFNTLLNQDGDVTVPIGKA
jgi:hypothetical protein